MFITVFDRETQNKKTFKLPKIEESFPYLKNIDIEKEELYHSFPEGYHKILNKNNLGSGGKIIIARDGRRFSRNIYVRQDSSHEPTPHLNFNIWDRDEETGRKKEHKLGEFHLIHFDNKTRVIDIILYDGRGKSIVQPIIILPTKKDSEMHKKLENL